MSTRRDWVLFGALGASLQIAAVLTALQLNRRDGFLLFLAGYWAMFVIYAFAVHKITQIDRRPKALLGFMFALAVTLRVPFLLTAPTLSDDINRYVWDGRVQRQGINPYRHAPQAPELQHLRDGTYDGINHKDIPTIYPPLMQMLFAATTAVSESIVWMKTTLTFVDLVLIGVLIGLLGAAGENPLRAVVYAWSPLVLVEVSGSGHNDVLALTFLLAAHVVMLHDRQRLSIFFLSLSGLAKLIGFVLAPLFIRSVRRTAWLVLPFTCLAVAWPYLFGGGPAAFRGLMEFGARWRANDSLFALLLELTGSLNLAKAVAGGVFVAIVAYAIYRHWSPLRSCYVAIGALLLLSTTVHPWYLVWIVPYLAFYPNPAWLLLTATVVLSYHASFLTPPGLPWVEQTFYKVLEYGPFLLLLIVSAFSPTERRVAVRTTGRGVDRGGERAAPE